MSTRKVGQREVGERRSDKRRGWLTLEGTLECQAQRVSQGDLR